MPEFVIFLLIIICWFAGVALVGDGHPCGLLCITLGIILSGWFLLGTFAEPVYVVTNIKGKIVNTKLENGEIKSTLLFNNDVRKLDGYIPETDNVSITKKNASGWYMKIFFSCPDIIDYKFEVNNEVQSSEQ